MDEGLTGCALIINGLPCSCVEDCYTESPPTCCDDIAQVGCLPGKELIMPTVYSMYILSGIYVLSAMLD